MPDNRRLFRQVYVKIDGEDATDEFTRDLLEVTVENSLHLPDVATLVLYDTRLHWIDDDSLAPGKIIQVSAKGGQQEQLLFDGEIVEIEPDFGPAMQRLIVRAFDRLHRLSRGRNVRSFLIVSDVDLVRKIAHGVVWSAQR